MRDEDETGEEQKCVESGTTTEDQFVRNVESIHRRLLGSNDSPNVCIIQDAVSKLMPLHVTVTAKAH
jgi:hypothetical protein